MVRASSLVLAAAALAALSACATPEGGARPAQTAQAAGAPGPSADTSVYGLYLAGHAALDAGDSRSAAELFGRASEKNPDADYLKARTFSAALVAGDIQRAAALSPPVDTADPGDKVLGVLTRTVEALAAGRGEEAYKEIEKAGDLGHGGAAIALLNDHTSLPLVVAAYGPFLERRGRRQEALGLYDQVLAANPDDAEMAISRARAAAKASAGLAARTWS